MSDDRHLRSSLQEELQRRHGLFDTVRVDDALGLGIDRRVDVGSENDGLACQFELGTGSYLKAWSFHTISPLSRGYAARRQRKARGLDAWGGHPASLLFNDEAFS